MKRPKAIDLVAKQILASIQHGHSGALLGHSGAGKSKVLQRTLQWSKATAVGYVSQHAHFPEQSTPREILSHALALRTSKLWISKEHKQHTQKALSENHLLEVKDKRLHELTLSHKRQLAFATAMLGEPQLLILDEPFAGLDPLAKVQVLDHLDRHKNSGGVMLVATNDPTSVQNLCEHIWILKDGQLSYDSTTEHGDKNVFNFRHALTVTGTKVDDLKQLGSTKNLKAWNLIYHNGFLCTLRFNDYPTASSWLKACLDAGLIVTKFGEDLSLNVEETAALFTGGTR